MLIIVRDHAGHAGASAALASSSSLTFFFSSLAALVRRNSGSGSGCTVSLGQALLIAQRRGNRNKDAEGFSGGVGQIIKESMLHVGRSWW
jgi:hypothetical protein